jgi:tyrosyl-tRNA synthetase
MLHGQKAAKESEQAAREAFSGNYLDQIHHQLKLVKKLLIKNLVLLI